MSTSFIAYAADSVMEQPYNKDIQVEINLPLGMEISFSKGAEYSFPIKAANGAHCYFLRSKESVESDETNNIAAKGKTTFTVSEKMSQKALNLSQIKAEHSSNRGRISTELSSYEVYYPYKRLEAEISGSNTLVGIKCEKSSWDKKESSFTETEQAMKIKEIPDYFSEIFKITKVELVPGKVENLKKELSDTTPVSDVDGHI
jgi:hypothetical protein